MTSDQNDSEHRDVSDLSNKLKLREAELYANALRR